MGFHECVPRNVSFAQDAIAFFKMSRAISARVKACLNRLMSVSESDRTALPPWGLEANPRRARLTQVWSVLLDMPMRADVAVIP